MCTEQQDRFIEKVEFYSCIDLPFLQLNARARPPDADNLLHFEHLSLLKFRIMEVLGALENSQVPMDGIKKGEAELRLAWLLFRD